MWTTKLSRQKRDFFTDEWIKKKETWAVLKKGLFIQLNLLPLHQQKRSIIIKTMLPYLHKCLLTALVVSTAWILILDLFVENKAQFVKFLNTILKSLSSKGKVWMTWATRYNMGVESNKQPNTILMSNNGEIPYIQFSCAIHYHSPILSKLE